MTKKSQEDFQKLILEILQKEKDERDKFREEIMERIENVENRPKENKVSTIPICSIVSSQRTLSTPEQMDEKVKQVTREIAPIMEKYKLSKLECYTAKIYD